MNRRRLFGLSLGFGLACWTLPLLAASSGTPLKELFNPKPSQTFNMMGYFATGLALVDLDHDGFNDVVVSNGNDMSPQSLVVYKNPATAPIRFSGWPDWYSSDINFRGSLSVADVNGDGWMDVAVSFPFDLSRRTSRGRVAVYFNRQGTLEPTPSYTTDLPGYMAVGARFGDVDADGDPDLVVPVYADVDVVYPPTTPITDWGGHALIYRNNAGTLETSPAWKSDEYVQASDVLVADVDLDGWMDLALAAQNTLLYYGRTPAAGNITLPTTADWKSSDVHTLSYSIDAGRLSPTSPVSLAVSAGCITLNDCGYGDKAGSTTFDGFVLYTPSRTSPSTSNAPVWSSPAANNASKLMLGDLNNDGYLELVAGSWGIAPAIGSTLWMFQGSASGLPSRVTFRTQTHTVLQTIGGSDLDRRAVERRTYTSPTGFTGAVLTLPERLIERVTQVTRAGQVLPPSQYCWVPGQNTISLKGALTAGEQVVVQYDYSPAPDLVVANWSPDKGIFVFLNFLN